MPVETATPGLLSIGPYELVSKIAEGGMGTVYLAEHVLIKPQHSRRIRSQDRLTPDDMVVIDLDGNLIEGQDRPPGERFIHTGIYRARPDVQAVVHTHQPMATVMGIGSAPIHPVLHVGSELVERPVPLWPCAKLVTDPGLGDQLAKALGDHCLVLLQGHGITSVAATVQEATINAIHLEQQAEAFLGNPAAGEEEYAEVADQLPRCDHDIEQISDWRVHQASHARRTIR